MDLQLRKAEKEQSNRVAITALERDGKLLMGLRGDTKKWGFPGGHLLQDESPLEGASRELFEETGLSPNGGEIQTVGDQFNETAGKHIHLFHGHCSDGEPTAVNDPDGEFQDFGWFGPEEIERLDLHIPPEQCIVHQMLLAEPMTKSEAPTWRSNQGLVIPASGTPQRIEFDANFLGHIVDLYAGGDIARIKKHLVQLSKVKTDKQPTSQDLVEFYTQMLQNGEAVPGLVVRRDDAGDLFLVDGINRYAALESAGEAKTWVYEILNDFAKSEETLTKTRPGPRFPKLGLPDDRRETELVDRVGEWKKKFYIRAATVDLINRVVPKKERAETQEHADENLIGDRMGMSAPAMRFGASPYAVTDSDLGSKWGPKTPIATRNHENAHMLFGRVRKMYGKQARQNLAENIWHHVENRLGPEKSGILNQYLSVRYPEAQRNGLDHEERMATVLNLVNDPAERKNLLGNKTQDINLVADIGKQAHQAMLEGGRLADAHWLKTPEKFQKKYATGVFQKSEAEDFSIEDPTAWNSSYLHDDLHPLAHLESEFGTAIKPNRQDGAVGAVALKPKVAWEAYAKSPTLQKLFPGLDQVSFLQKLSEDHKLYNLVSSAVFAAAKAKHGTPEKAAFAWRYGNAIANRATDQQVLADPYVRQYSELLGNQLAEQPLNKSLEYVVNNTTGSTWKSSYGVDLVVSRDPHDRSQWRTTVLVKSEPVRHFVAKSHYDALLTAESLGADFSNPGHSLVKAEPLQKDDLQTKASPASPIATKDPQPRPQGPVHVDAVRHSLPGFLKHDEVHDLMHGLDLNQPRDHKTVGPGINKDQSYWMNGPKGKVYVKESTPTPDAHSDAQAEGAYHNVAKDFFGMGQYVPNVGAFEHPETGKHVAVVQSVDGEHHDIDNDNHEFNLHQIHKSGDLHKLALMNMLMQNADRHKYNYLLPKEGGLKLIDHGLGFSWSNEPDLPHYVKAAHGLPNYYAKNAGSKHFKANKNIDWNDPKNLGPEIHPEAAKWAMKLNPTELKNQIASHGIHPDVANESANRLKALQVFLTQHPKASITEAYRTPQSMTSQGAFNNSQVKTGK